MLGDPRAVLDVWVQPVRCGDDGGVLLGRGFDIE
jgi:hypothetical protein